VWAGWRDGWREGWREGDGSWTRVRGFRVGIDIFSRQGRYERDETTTQRDAIHHNTGIGCGMQFVGLSACRPTLSAHPRGSVLSKEHRLRRLCTLEIRSRYARPGECTRSKGKAKQAIAAAKTSAGQSSSRMRCTAVRACICHSVGAVCFLRVAVSFLFLWRVYWEHMD
jgi:hypothetical protein